MPRPSFSTGDTWTYWQTREIHGRWSEDTSAITVAHEAGDMVAIDVSQPGSPMPPRDRLVGADWSFVRDVDGRSTVVNRPLAFPLSIGKMWVVEYTEHNPNPNHLLEHYRSPYRMVGWEKVTVPAGTFDALKIESEGTWDAVVAPRVSASTGATASVGSAVSVSAVTWTVARKGEGRTYKAFWYVPAVRRWVKSEEDYYSNKGERSAAYTTELASFRLVPP